MAKVRMGILSDLMYNSADYGNPNFDINPIDLVGDLGVEAAWDEGESSTRRTQVHTFNPTLMGMGLTGRIRVDETDPHFLYMDNAFFARNSIDILVLNGPYGDVGARGFRFNGRIIAWSEDQALGNVIYKDFTIRPCASDNKVKRAFIDVDQTLSQEELPETA